MTFAEALAELGISADATPDQARRAYLRLLKTRKPEVDPEGFMRLRGAFDQVKGILGARTAFGRRGMARADEGAREEPSGPDGPREETSGDDGLGEEAGDAAPADPEPRQPPDDVVRGGDPEPEDEPSDEADEDDEDDDEEEDDPPTLVEAERLLAAGDPGGAAAEVERLFDAALEDPGGPLPPLHLAMRALLTLHEHALLDEVSTLQQSVEAWLDATKLETRLFRGNAVLVWAMTRELGALGKKFPASARATIARGLRTGRLDVLRAELIAWQERRPTLALEAATRLHRRAPLLARSYGDLLDPSTPETPTRSTPRGSTWGFGVALMVMLNVLRMVFSTSTTSAPSYTPTRAPAYQQAPSRSSELTSSELWARALHRNERVLSHARFHQAQLGGSLTLDYKQMETLAFAVDTAAQTRDCTGAVRAIRAIEAIPTVGDDIARVEVAELVRAIDRVCSHPVDGVGAMLNNAPNDP